MLDGVANPVASHDSVWLYLPKGTGENAGSLPPDPFAPGLVLTNQTSCVGQNTRFSSPTLTDVMTGEEVTAEQYVYAVLDIPAGPQRGSYALGNGGVWAHTISGFFEAVIRLAP